LGNRESSPQDRFRRVPASGSQAPAAGAKRKFVDEFAGMTLYSAAADNEAFDEALDGAFDEALDAFGLVADIMKSEMRGTISDLNREPLNTP
jgi:hypothetical protein